LAVQPLLPALALRRPVLLKSPSSEPLFAPAFVAALAVRLPALAPALAAITWPGGDAALEAPLLAAAGRVVAYGEQESLDDLEQRAPGKVVAYGPKTSLAVVGAAVEPQSVAAGLARDVALFDQRGCLSIQAVYTLGDPTALAEALAAELVAVAEEWPSGPLDPVSVAAVQQIRSEAQMRGLIKPELAIDVGTVVVEPQLDFRPSPGVRTVRVHPLDRTDRLPEILAPWAGQLQGAALAGDDAWALQKNLEALGISRCAEPGQLQTPDALWHNGGVHPLITLAD
ncbi:MAG: acyl-CoA reductase, partial [Thermoanaerobaculia bacterium]